MVSEVPVDFTLAEIYYLQGLIRYEMPGEEHWKYPPVSERLNDAVAEAYESLHHLDGTPKPTETAQLLLTRHDTYVLDYHCRTEHRTGQGEMVGRNILLKAFRARKSMDLGVPFATTEEHDQTYTEALYEREVEDAHSTITNDDANDSAAGESIQATGTDTGPKPGAASE